jgi:peptidoglycan/xylan/chitin deacetylase (PgdA/CDA1 family)
MMRATVFGLGRLLLSAAVVLSALAASAAAQVPAQPQRRVAVTFDDLPTPYGELEDMRRITARLLAPLRRHRVPAVGFVNEGRLFRPGELDARAAVLKAWLDAGMELGNHTFSHIDLRRATLDEYRYDVVRGENVTRMLLADRGMKLRYFRHPFLMTGPTPEYKRGIEEFLAARGYTVAPVTVHNSDYVFAEVYFKARSRGDEETAKRVADAYVPYTESVFEHFERLSTETFGREIAQVLLLHANDLNADRFDALAVMLARRGYTLVTLEEALKDPAYAEPDGPHANGISWLHRWRAAKGLPAKWEPEVPKFVGELYRAGQRRN